MRYLPLLCALLILLPSGTAFAWIPNSPLHRARAHCRMMMASLQERIPSTPDEILATIGKENWSGVMEPDMLQRGWEAGYNIVDMAFLLGRRWETLNRDQRYRFGRALSRLLLQGSHVAPNAHLDGMCIGKLTDATQVETFILDEKGRPVSMVYVFTQEPKGALLLSDIILAETRLSQSFQKSYKALMSKESVEEILAKLEAMTGISKAF